MDLRSSVRPFPYGRSCRSFQHVPAGHNYAVAFSEEFTALADLNSGFTDGDDRHNGWTGCGGDLGGVARPSRPRAP